MQKIQATQALQAQNAILGDPTASLEEQTAAAEQVATAITILKSGDQLLVISGQFEGAQGSIQGYQNVISSANEKFYPDIFLNMGGNSYLIQHGTAKIDGYIIHIDPLAQANDVYAQALRHAMDQGDVDAAFFFQFIAPSLTHPEDWTRDILLEGQTRWAAPPTGDESSTGYLADSLKSFDNEGVGLFPGGPPAQYYDQDVLAYLLNKHFTQYLPTIRTNDFARILGDSFDPIVTVIEQAQRNLRWLDKTFGMQRLMIIVVVIVFAYLVAAAAAAGAAETATTETVAAATTETATAAETGTAAAVIESGSSYGVLATQTGAEATLTESLLVGTDTGALLAGTEVAGSYGVLATETGTVGSAALDVVAEAPVSSSLGSLIPQSVQDAAGAAAQQTASQVVGQVETAAIAGAEDLLKPKPATTTAAGTGFNFWLWIDKILRQIFGETKG
jgi:hypothetical protein